MTSRTVAPAAALLAFVATVRAAWAIIPAPQIVAISNVTVTEGDVGMTMFKAQVSVMYTQSPVEVDIVAMPGTATDDDFSFTPVHLTLTPGTLQEVTGVIIGDRDFEGDETFALRATITNGALTPFNQGGIVTIVDDDRDAASRLSVEGATVPEGSAGWHTVEVRVRLEPAVPHTVSVAFRTVGGVPVPGTPWGDYRAASDMLSFAPGETSKAIPIDVNGDSAWEPDARFNVELLEPPRGAGLGTASAEIVLTNDDAPTVVTIDDMQVMEGQSGKRAVSVRLRFDPPTPPFAKVHVNLVGGSARAGEDFVDGAQDLYPAPGSSSMTFELDVLSDTTPECDEGVLIEYQGIDTGDDTPRVARVLILDDDGGPRGAGTGDGGACPDPFVTRTVPRETDGGPPPGADGSAADSQTGTQNDGAVEKPANQPHGGCAVAPGPRSPTSLLTALVLIAAFRAARRRR
jgi:large repetitive protein